MTTTQILIPERWLVQPQVVPMHVLRDPQRKQEPSLIAQRQAETISTYAAASYCGRGRMLAVSMNPPDATGLQILHHILTAGDRRYWTWTATKHQSGGFIRRSLCWELNLDPSNLNKALARLIDDGVVEIVEKQTGREALAITNLGKMLFAEVRWRWYLRDSVTAFLQPMADNYGWQEISIQVDHYMTIKDMDKTRKADVIFAAKEKLKDGVDGGGVVRRRALEGGGQVRRTSRNIV